MKVDTGTPRDEAALLLSWLQANGAICSINADGFLHVDLNPVTSIRDNATAERIANAVLGLREELKALLLTDQVIH